MAPPRKGSLESYVEDGRRRYEGRVRLKDGTRSGRLEVPLEKCRDEKAARGWIAWMQEQEDIHGRLLAAKLAKAQKTPASSPGATAGETVEKYAGRWLKAREGRIASTRDNKGHLESHILPVLGPLPMAGIARADVERFVGALDAKVRAGEIGAKTAKNVWGTCSKMFDDATNAKPAEGLRCLAADPTSGVRGPDDNDADKLLQFLYPSEFAAFVNCVDVPVRWRRNAAIAVYLCLRDGEQRALKWPAVDLEHGVVTILETFDRRTSADREGTKSGAARIVQIRPELLPLLEAMHKESGGEGYVCELPSLRDMARGLRRYLKKAKVERAQLHTGTTVSKQLRWHDLRATGATWLAVEGKGPTEIRDVLGHTQTSMTDRYMRSAAMLRGGRFGEVFPPLPASLGVSRDWPTDWPNPPEATAMYSKQLRGGRDSNPRPPA